jgi:DeoR/GlpR family transcriptional regulator of sugar metabolism
MIARQRDEKIVALLRQAGSISAQELASTLEVSTATIRRDLDRLEHQGQINRVHGGAFYAHDLAGESPFEDVVNENAPEKDAVAERAAELVADGDVVFLDIGTTTMRIAHHLRGRHITVITTSLAVLDELRHDEAVDLVLLGGSLRRNFQTLVGPITEDAMTTIRADLAFLACTGVRPDGAIVDDISQEATIKRAIVSSSDKVALVATSSKFPGKGSLRISHLSQLDYVITNRGADEATLAHCIRSGGQVFTV